MSKLCQTFQSPFKPSQTFMLFHTTYLPPSEFWVWSYCGQISENIFCFLNLLMQKIFFDKNNWFQLLSTKNNWIISMFLISVILHSLSLGHSIMSSFCWQKKKIFGFRWKFYCYSSPSHLTWENYVSRLALSFFRFFSFRFLAYWDHYCKFARFNSLEPLQNVLIKSP